jgi:DNA mismatch repair protein MutS2
MRSKIPVYQLERSAEGHPPAAQHGVFFSRPARRSVASEIDLRGQRVDEALGRLDSWLNDAALEDSTNLRVIHGKGTGVLRRAVRDYLDGHPLVAAAATGEGPGGDGVTVVELK